MVDGEYCLLAQLPFYTMVMQSDSNRPSLKNNTLRYWDSFAWGKKSFLTWNAQSIGFLRMALDFELRIKYKYFTHKNSFFPSPFFVTCIFSKKCVLAFNGKMNE